MKRFWPFSKVSHQIEAIIRLMDSDPDSWSETIGGYYLTHSGGMRIWIGNFAPDMKWAREITIGDSVVLAKAGGCWATKDHKAIHAAVGRFKSRANKPDIVGRYIAKAEIEMEERWMNRRVAAMEADRAQIDSRLN